MSAAETAARNQYSRRLLAGFAVCVAAATPATLIPWAYAETPPAVSCTTPTTGVPPSVDGSVRADSQRSPGPDTTPPSAPTGLRVSDVSQTSLTLSWSPSTDDVGVVGYEVWGSLNRCMPILVATVPGTSLVVALTGGPNATYGFNVKARDAAGNVSALSDTLSVAVSASPTTPSTPRTSVSGSPSRSASPGTCRVTYQRQSRWPGGFVAGVTITNTGTSALKGWTLAFAFGGDQRILSSWGATYTQSGANVTLTNAAWNAVIVVGTGVSLGFHGTWTTNDSAPAGFTLNGYACAVG